jgi:anti-anti-sigma factor
VRLHVRGQLDLAAVGAFGEALMRATQLRWPVEIDLAEVDFIDGSGLSMLINAMSRARLGRRQLAIVNASRCVRHLIEVTDTADRLSPVLVGSRGQRARSEERRLALRGRRDSQVRG